MRRTVYTVAVVAAGAVGLTAAATAVAVYALLGVAKRAEVQLAHLEDWMPPPPWLTEP